MVEDLDMICWIEVFCGMIRNKMRLTFGFWQSVRCSYSHIARSLGGGDRYRLKRLVFIGRKPQPFALNIPYIVLNVYDK
jgi:hypothetical protein